MRYKFIQYEMHALLKMRTHIMNENKKKNIVIVEEELKKFMDFMEPAEIIYETID